MKQVDNSLRNLDADDSERALVRNLISMIREVNHYQELYDLLGFEYVIDCSGSLESLEKESFDFVVSAGVGEHIYAKEIPKFVDAIATLLKPGGYSVNSINILFGMSLLWQWL